MKDVTQSSRRRAVYTLAVCGLVLLLLSLHPPGATAVERLTYIDLVDRLTDLEHLATLPTLRQDGLMEQPLRIATSLQADIAVAEAAKLDAQKIAAFETTLSTLAIAIEERYFLQGKNAVSAEPMKGLG